MATVIEPRRADDVEELLVQLDADYSAVYGPDLASWSRGVRGEFFELQRSRRAMDREVHPLHPRKASAARRRRHQRQLPWRISQIAPDAVTVLLAPVWTDTTGESHRHYLAQCFDADGHKLRLPLGGSRQLAALMQGAFPGADWNRAQTWRADTNQLTGWQQRKAVA
ncbi:hypothetical protein [Streptomyces sp. NPDC001530]|uniref:hypothetical protein n=1 Tax=Streptomyces sp. NPDC001530 TaxID=3364582 RepID=UPI003676B32F